MVIKSYKSNEVIKSMKSHESRHRNFFGLQTDIAQARAIREVQEKFREASGSFHGKQRFRKNLLIGESKNNWLVNWIELIDQR